MAISFRDKSPLFFVSLALFASTFLMAPTRSLEANEDRALPVSVFPEGAVTEPRQARIVFRESVRVPGAKDSAPPAELSCSEEQGTWLDEKTYAFTFASPLAAGKSCSFRWNKAFFSDRKMQMPGAKLFHTGGPQVEETKPSHYGVWTQEGVFAVRTSAPTLEASLRGRVKLLFEGVAETVPAELFTVSEADLEDFLKSFRWKKELAAQKQLFFFRTQRSLPEGNTITLVWEKGIRSLEGVESQENQVLEFVTRQPFQATLNCERENSAAGCVPISPIELNFNEEVEWKLAKEIRLISVASQVSKSGTSQPPNQRNPDPLSEFSPSVPEDFGARESNPNETVRSLSFRGPFPEKSQWQIKFPMNFADSDGRKLQVTPKSTFRVSVGEAPLLAKFSGKFGVVESTDPIVPLTVRSLESKVRLQSMRLSPSAIEADPTLPFRWLQNVENAKREESIFSLRTEGLQDQNLWEMFKSGQPSEAQPKAGDFSGPGESLRKKQLLGSTESLTLGLPLSKEGLHVLQINSQEMGKRLLSQIEFPQRSFWVSSAALVTDLALHAKVGASETLVWATRLSTGSAAERVKVFVVNCYGDRLGPELTDRSGLVTFRTEALQKPCAYGAQEQKRKKILSSNVLHFLGIQGQNVGLLREDENRGVEIWRFQSDSTERTRPQVKSPYALLLERTLFRKGERFHAALHSFGPVNLLPQCLVAVHTATNERKKTPIKWNSVGVASVEFVWEENQKKGTYQVFGQKRCGEDEEPWDAFPAHQVRLEDFSLPTVELTLQLPQKSRLKDAQGQKGLAQVKYLSGGFAAGQKAQLNFQMKALRKLEFGDFPGYDFATPPIKTGIAKAEEWEEVDSETDSEALESPVAGGELKNRQKTLGAKGDLEFSLPKWNKQKSEATAVRLETELQFAEPGGVLRTARSSQEYPLNELNVGIRAKRNNDKNRSHVFEVAVVDSAGKPVANEKVEVQVFPVQRHSVRKKILGGLYTYESFRNIRSSVFRCEIVSSSDGKGSCVWKGESGSYFAEASTVSTLAGFQAGSRSTAFTQIWREGSSSRNNVDAESDRLDIKLEKKVFAVGEKARVEIVSQWEVATALVTLEASNVLKSFVREVRRESPFVEFPVGSDLLPNATVTVLLVRGRAEKNSPQGMKPGEVDLGKPSFRFGLAHFRVETQSQRMKIEMALDQPSYRVRSQGNLQLKVLPPKSQLLPADTRVTVFAVDKALLQLSQNLSTDLAAQLFPLRSLDVNTATAMLNVVGKRHFGLKARPPGGGGGRFPTREIFDALLFWKTNLKPDAEGRINLPFSLKDSITEYRIFAFATSASQKFFGSEEQDFETRQDILTLASFPQRMRSHDSFSADFVLRNTTKEKADVQVFLQVEGRPQERLKLSEDKLALEPGVAKTVVSDISWKLLESSISENSKKVLRVPLVFEIQRNGVTEDRIKKLIHLEPSRGARSLAASLLSVSTTALARTYALPMGGEVLFENLPGGPGPKDFFADYLKSYRYECTEQLLSKAVVSDEESQWKSFTRVLESRTDDTGLVKYFSSENLKGDVWLTAYVLVLSKVWERPLPEAMRLRFIAALKQELSGKVGDSDLSGLRSAENSTLAAEALARHGEVFKVPGFLRSPNLSALSWESFLSLGAALFSDKNSVFSEGLRLKWKEQMRNRTLRSGAVNDLAALDALTPLQAQLIRARALEVFGMEGLGETFSTLRSEVEQAHVRGLQGLRSPSTFWSVWALLAVKEFEKRKINSSVALSRVQVDTGKSLIPLLAVDKTLIPVLGGSPLVSFKVSGTGGTGSGSGALVLESVRSLAPVTEAEHRGMRIDCANLPKEMKVGELYEFQTKLIPSGNISGWTVVEVPLFPGLQVMSFDSSAESDPWAPVPEFVEKSDLSWKIWYLNLGSRSSSTRWSLRPGVKGTFRVPGCRGESVSNPDVSSESPEMSLRVL